MLLLPLTMGSRLENGIYAGVLLICALVMISGVDLPDQSGLRSWEGRLGTIPESLYPRLRGMWVRWQRGAGLGAVGGLAVGEATFWLAPGGTRLQTLTILVPMASFFVGAAVGRCIAAITTPAPRDLPQRVARTQAAALDDYLSPLDRAKTVIAIILAGVTLAGFAALWGSGQFVPGVMLAYFGPIMAVLGLLSCWGASALGRRLLEAPEPAATMRELLWLDAARASVLRKLGDPALAFGAYGVMSLCLSLDPAASAMFYRTGQLGPGWVTAVLAVALITPFIMFVGIMVLSLVIQGQQNSWFLKRLWPDGSPAA